MTTNLPETSTKLRSAVTAAARGLVDREPLVELVALSAVARELLLVIGPPGTAKSVAVRRIAQATGGRYFDARGHRGFAAGNQSLKFKVDENLPTEYASILCGAGFERIRFPTRTLIISMTQCYDDVTWSTL
jgi:hypothetical protein